MKRQVKIVGRWVTWGRDANLRWTNRRAPLCSIRGCRGRGTRSFGMCAAHQRRFNLGQSLKQPIGAGTTRVRVALDAWQELLDHADLAWTWRNPRLPLCPSPGCVNRARSGGLCWMHLKRRQRGQKMSRPKLKAWDLVKGKVKS